jgi:hypothetical protein
MSLEDLGNIGEFIAALAVVVSLIYLAVQIRQNTRSVRASTYQVAVGSISDWSREVSLDSNAPRIFSVGCIDPDQLTADERLQLYFQLVSLFRNYENLFYQHHQGMIEDSAWVGWAYHMVRTYWSPGVQGWWPSWRMTCQGEFREFLENSSPPVGDPFIQEDAERLSALGFMRNATNEET